jgi:ATP-binding cassette, subfamily F, member 2
MKTPVLSSVTNFTLQHMGAVLLDESEIVLNHGNRYGLIGRNGCGKSTLLKALGARAVPIPTGIDIFFLDEEVAPSDTITAIEAVMSVDEERLRLENHAEELNQILAQIAEAIAKGDEFDMNNGDGEDVNDKTLEEQQEQIMETLNTVYERLDALDADTAEVRARSILKGLGFTHDMQSKLTKDFSGGWRMRVSLARALFIQPICLLLDEPTNHLDMEAVIWLEDYLSRWDKILLLVSHSQDFLNNVCTHMIHFTKRKKLVYYDGNYDQFMKTKSEKEENQWKQYKWEQEQIKSMKEYIARFGHGTAKNAKQAQSKEKVLQKMIRAGLTEKPEEEKPLNFKFTDPGHLPPPVLAFHDVKFGYPGCEPLYSNVNLGIDLDSRIALVG